MTVPLICANQIMYLAFGKNIYIKLIKSALKFTSRFCHTIVVLLLEVVCQLFTEQLISDPGDDGHSIRF